MKKMKFNFCSLFQKNNIFNKDVRTLEVWKNSILMAIIKGFSLLLSFISVPILINSLNTINYGIWITLTSIVGWLSFTDLGLGLGVRNKVGESIAKNNHSATKSYISSGYFSLLIITSILIFLTIAFTRFINWAKVLNAPITMINELYILVTVVISLFALNITLKLIESILYALQKPAIVSLISFISQLFNVIVIYSMSKSKDKFSLVHYGIVLSLIPNIVLLVSTILLFSTKYKKYSPSFSFVRKKYIKNVTSKGGEFFLIQLTALALFQTNNIVIAQMVNPSAVTDFNIAYKYFSVLGMFFLTLTTPLWSATTDAYYNHDIYWIEKNLKLLKKIYKVSAIIAILMLAMSQAIYKLWLGDSLKVNWNISFLVCLYQILSLRTAIYCSFINGIGKIRLQFYFTLFEAILHIPLAILLAKYWGVVGVLISMCLMTAINNIWEPIQLKKIINQTAEGIWEK